MSQLIRIPFNGDEILAVDHNGKPHIVLRPALELLGIDYATQLRKLKAKSWATVGTSPTQDQYRDMTTVDVRTFLMLLATIDEKRVAARIRPKLVAYQNEVADAIEAYWTHGGAINPCATEDQLTHIIDRARAQATVLAELRGIVDPAWLEAKARHVAARALGEEPDIDPASRPLTVGEYLTDRGVTGSALRSLSSTFGKRVKGLYQLKHDTGPPKVERFVDGALRAVAGYTERDRPLFDAAWQQIDA
ncbi:phage antirepressor N-terminal domain-containing protein [Micromonospora sp. WMMA1363]|uniref:phage antirepressor N-terminal domain-containing protein n=1 Tax=Micromonospora sp. WMMA1363 TaxID=3053985 RepID=UPI00259C9298|nr:phage antirepressor N-terminal domain-containing protein [Micromonospora sp. WMMA1363]MDM4722789.1 phage antirepressor N-terminal domain-containing protein [Micromonospora sp. WMMA1363]